MKPKKESIEEFLIDNEICNKHVQISTDGSEVLVSVIIQKALEHFQEDKTVSDEDIEKEAKYRQLEGACPQSWIGACNWMRDKLKNNQSDNWVSVEDRLPEQQLIETSKRVLVIVDGKYEIMRYNHVQGFWNTMTGTEKVTHWQPLPQPPKK